SSSTRRGCSAARSSAGTGSSSSSARCGRGCPARRPPRQPARNRSSMMSLLTLENVVKRFGGLVAVNNFSTQLQAGELCALIGPNGSGKTTIFNLISGIYEPTEGKIAFDEQDVTGKRPDLIAGLGIARTFQNIRLFRGLDVLG